MNLIEAFNLSRKLMKGIRRKSWPDYCHNAVCGYVLNDNIGWWIHAYITDLDSYYKMSFAMSDFLADDWEIVE